MNPLRRLGGDKMRNRGYGGGATQNSDAYGPLTLLPQTHMLHIDGGNLTPGGCFVR